MKKILLASLVSITVFLASGCPERKSFSDTQPADTTWPKPVQAETFFSKIPVGGTELQILIRTENTQNPVLLYLHGGPGHSLIPWAEAATGDLTRDFTVVYYDQRGTGLSLDETADPDLNTMERFLTDCLEVVQYLKERYGQEKICLIGHSWGSVLGMRMISRYPEHFSGYIGIGQIVHWERQVACSRNWLTEQIQREGGSAQERETASDGYFFGPYYGLLRKYGGIIHALNGDEVMALAARSSYAADRYTDDLFARGLAFSHSGGDLLRAYTTADFFTEIPETSVPVAFFCGRYDYLTAAPVAAEYLGVVNSPRKQLYWFENSAHRCDIEESELFRQRVRAFFTDPQ